MGRWTNIISYLTLAIASGGCLYLIISGTGKSEGFTLVALGIIATYALMGFLRAAFNSTSESSNIQNFMARLIPPIALPFVATEVWLKYNVIQKEVDYAHAVIGVLIVLANLVSSVSHDLIDLVVSTCSICLGVAGAINANAFAVCAAFCFLLAHFGSTRFNTDQFNLSVEDMDNYFLAGFCGFTLMSLM